MKYCETKIPRTARKESHIPASNTESGDIERMMKNEKRSVVSISFSSCRIYAKYTIADIRKALVVDSAKPVSAR